MDLRHPVSRVVRFTLTALLCLSSASSAVELEGSFASEVYGWTEADAEHLKPYQRLQTDFGAFKLSSRIRLDWHTNLRWSSDILDKGENDPELSVYQSYARLSGLPSKIDLRLGRQFVLNGIGSSFIDGLRLSGVPHADYRADLFIGSAVNRLEPEKIRAFKDWLAIGTQISYRLNARTQLAYSFFYRQDNGSLDRHWHGLTATRSGKNWNGYGRFVYDLADKQLADLIARVTVPMETWQITAEYANRTPKVRFNSLFSLIDSKKQQDLRLSLTRALNRGWRLVGSVKTGKSGNDSSVRTSLGITTGNCSVHWTTQSGDRGRNNGFNGTAQYQVDKRWWLHVSAGRNSYLVQLEQEDRLTAWYGLAGLTYELGHGLELKAEAQTLRNAISQHDTRLLFRISKQFSIGADND